MKTIILSVCILLFSTSNLCAQTVSIVTYQCSLNTGNREMQGVNTLYFSQSEALFVHTDYPKQDSYTENGGSVSYKKSDSEGLPVYTNLSEGYLKWKLIYNPRIGPVIFTDTIPNCKWVIKQERKQIGPYLCQKAVGKFAGRIYDVWFTPEIPVPLGPYKLGGLPGLILNAESRDGYVSYQFKMYSKSSGSNVSISPPTDGRELSWEEFQEEIIENLLLVESMSTDEYTITNKNPKPNWHIEKNRITIIDEFNAKRKN